MTIDEDKDGSLSAAELKALIVGINFEEIDFDEDDAVNKIMSDFDTSNNSKLELDEFINGISRWLRRATGSREVYTATNVGTMKFLESALLVS